MFCWYWPSFVLLSRRKCCKIESNGFIHDGITSSILLRTATIFSGQPQFWQFRPLSRTSCQFRSLCTRMGRSPTRGKAGVIFIHFEHFAHFLIHFAHFLIYFAQFAHFGLLSVYNKYSSCVAPKSKLQELHIQILLPVSLWIELCHNGSN